ncbi:aminoglycoside phosphotransferase family protein [Streptomyces sp. 796.1]|uniref:aminoglycoside phosphotransferase family protein n=1 Tax=Streptomyces sp. 796.1 TaxID=3163029 RepID=UPI0039C980D2
MDVLTTHRALLHRLLPGDAPDQLAVLEGQFHYVVRGARRVVCLPRTAAAARRLPQRAAVLRTLAGLDLGFRTPEPIADGTGSEPADEAGGGSPGPARTDPPFLVLSRIPGAPLERGALDRPGVGEAVAAQFAALLAGLAAAGDEPRVRAALPAEPADRWQRFAAQVRAELFGMMSAAGREQAAAELAAVTALPRRTTALVHGDLGAENVLWTTDAAGLPLLSGVVDWDEVMLGDPAEDLAAIAASYGPDLLTRVRAHAPAPDPDLTTRAAAIRGTFALQQALAAHQDEDAEELADGLMGYC